MRITGGMLRSRAVEAPRGNATRPTSDRVREAVFSMLASDGFFSERSGPLRVLDLYAGTGALAFEALSRGATHATCVEQGREALAVIRANARALEVDSLTHVLGAKVERALSTLKGPFDLVFLDPPYAEVRAPGFLRVLAEAGALLADGGALVLEHAAIDEPPMLEGLVLNRSRRHGDTVVSFYRRESKNEVSDSKGSTPR